MELFDYIMSQENAQALLQQLQLLNQRIADLNKREVDVSHLLREAHFAANAVRAIGEKPESETLIPIGMGVHVKTTLSSKENVVLTIGAGISLEKDRDSALNFLESKIKEIEIVLQNIHADRQESVEQLEYGKQEMSRLNQQGNP